MVALYQLKRRVCQKVGVSQPTKSKIKPISWYKSSNFAQLIMKKSQLVGIIVDLTSLNEINLSDKSTFLLILTLKPLNSTTEFSHML